VAKIQNLAKEILANATAQSEYLINEAEVNSSKQLEDAHNEGII
jgi:hypothetical protein